ncbi:MAG: hypothetical protein ACJ79S_09430, partial [Gemmatimonadaceae bacterium]
MVDPREQLRRYLEQRRDLGESELVLDGMTVEEVMRILGAAGAARPPARGGDSEAERARPADLGDRDAAPP